MGTSSSLPTELLEKIISETWSLPLSNDDRITLMSSSLLISTTWKTLFLCISLRDVHIMSDYHLDQYLMAIAGYPLTQLHAPHHVFCQTLTIRIQPLDADTGDQDNELLEEPPMGKTLSNLLYYLDGIMELPNLHTLRIEYEDVDYDDIFDHWRFIHFPKQISILEISFTFSNSALGSLLWATHERHDYEGVPYSLLCVRKLSISGASDAFVADMVACCPKAVIERAGVQFVTPLTISGK